MKRKTFDFYMNHNFVIKPIVKNEKYFQNWVDVYSFYINVKKEEAKLVDAA